MDLGFDINDPKHFVPAQVVERFERDPLIVVAAAMSEVYEVAAARHELPVVFGALNRRTQGAVGKVPVTQPCNRVAPANAQGLGGVGGDPTGMERGRLREGDELDLGPVVLKLTYKRTGMTVADQVSHEATLPTEDTIDEAPSRPSLAEAEDDD
ncbi:MAG: hypothetical protein VCB43_08770, partial [Myxococcota bacterium]